MNVVKKHIVFDEFGPCRWQCLLNCGNSDFDYCASFLCHKKNSFTPWIWIGFLIESILTDCDFVAVFINICVPKQQFESISVTERLWCVTKCDCCCSFGNGKERTWAKTDRPNGLDMEMGAEESETRHKRVCWLSTATSTFGRNVTESLINVIRILKFSSFYIRTKIIPSNFHFCIAGMRIVMQKMMTNDGCGNKNNHFLDETLCGCLWAWKQPNNNAILTNNRKCVEKI